MAVLKNNGLLWLIVNALLPWDTYCAYRLSQYKQQIARCLPVWLDVWFELEATCSLAAFAYLNPEYTLPDVVENEEGEQDTLLQTHELGHPLIPVEKKITNSFTLHQRGKVVIITGSNMSGKSTFLRTLGVNLCLAYAGGPVNAIMLQTSLFRVFTCMRISDSVTDGYSYFYAEVKRLRKLLEELKQENEYPLFILIDEIFKGTNNRERLNGSRAYVQAIVGRNCMGLISTHDLELVKLAEILPQVENYHFREEVVNGAMIFDYLLRPGPCPTTNALKIMKMEGLPVEES
jgi:DNA mismatch repair ATPase MutS